MDTKRARDLFRAIFKLCSTGQQGPQGPTEDVLFDSVDLQPHSDFQCYCCTFQTNNPHTLIEHVNTHLQTRDQRTRDQASDRALDRDQDTRDQPEEEQNLEDSEGAEDIDFDDLDFVEPDCVVCGANDPPTDYAGLDHDHPFRPYHRSCAPTRLDRVRLGLEKDPYDDREK